MHFLFLKSVTPNSNYRLSKFNVIVTVEYMYITVTLEYIYIYILVYLSPSDCVLCYCVYL